MVGEDIPIDAIMLDPSRNMSRGCTVDPPSHPKVEEIAKSLRADGEGKGRLLHCVGIYRLDKPVQRPCGKGRQCCPEGATGEHTWGCCYGFRRLVALRAVGRTLLMAERTEYQDLTGCSDRMLIFYNATENFARANPTEAQEATMLVAIVQATGWTLTELAQNYGEKDTRRVECLLRIATRLPEDVFAAFRRNPSRERRQALDRISRIDMGDSFDAEKRHGLMRQEWAAYEAWEAQEKERAEASTIAEGPEARAPRAPRNSSRFSPRRWLECVDRAVEIRDPQTGVWREVSVEERAYLRALLTDVARGKRADGWFR